MDGHRGERFAATLEDERLGSGERTESPCTPLIAPLVASLIDRVVGRVDRSRAFRGADAKRFGKQWRRAASLGEAVQDLLAPRTGVALRPPRIGQVSLRRVRASTRTQREGPPARRDDRFQRPQEPSTLVEQALFDYLIRLEEQRLRDRQSQRLGRLEVDNEAESIGLFYRQIFGASRP